MLRIINFTKCHFLELLSVLMLAAAGFFFINVQQVKASLKKTNTEMFISGENVLVTKVIDGDELMIKNKAGAKTVFRLLGIKSFNPTTSDPAILEYGKICFNYLQQIVANKDAIIELPEDNIIDKKGRLIGYLYLKGKDDKYTFDVGKLLVKKGFSMVFTKYDFAKMKEYLDVEAIAKREHAGFWSNTQIKSRVESLKKMWLEEKLTND